MTTCSGWLNSVGATTSATDRRSSSAAASTSARRRRAGTMSTRSNRPRTRSPSSWKLNSRSTSAGMIAPSRELLLAEPAQRLATRRRAAPPRARATGTPRTARPRRTTRPARPRSSPRPVRGAGGTPATARVDRRAIDHRVVRRERDPQDVPELVLARAGQVVVDGVERERQRLAATPPRLRPAPARRARGSRGARAASWPARPPPMTPAATGRSSASSTNGETRRARCPP